MRFIIVLFILVLSLYAADLDLLLNTYEKESDLSNETKVENTGTTQLTVYTKKDLERLNYQSLKDVLLVHRFFPYRESRLGYVDLLSGEPAKIGKLGQLVKIFIDDYEITSLYYGTGLVLLGNIELDFVDHIEIYEGPASYEHATEASINTIKLYSKSGRREVGSKVGASIDNYGAHKEYAYTGNFTDDLEYYFYASNRNLQREKIENEGTDVSRDEKQQHIYSTIKYGENNFVFQYLNKNKDGFLTNSFNGTPTKDDIEQSILHIGYDTKFLDDNSLSLKMSFDKIIMKEDFEDNYSGIYSYAVNAENYNVEEESFSVDLNKKYNTQNNTLLIGSLAKFKKIDYKKYELFVSQWSIPVDLQKKINNQNYYSLYIQDSYRINENNTIMLSAKLDHEDTSNFDEETMLHRRIAHTYSNGNLTIMTYYAYSPILKTAYIYNAADNGIKNESVSIFSNEISYVYDKFELRYNINKAYLHDLAVNTTLYNGPVVNVEDDFDLLLNSLRVTYNYTEQDSLMVEFWREDVKLNEPTLNIDIDNYTNGLHVRALNKYKKFDILNELVIIDSIATDTSGDMGWQYNLGVTYQHSKDLKFYIKGDNIFDTAIENKYENYKSHLKTISSVDQRFSFGVEYTF